VALYLATPHFYGWYALNVLELTPHGIALHLGDEDGGKLVRELYGHPDAAMARAHARGVPLGRAGGGAAYGRSVVIWRWDLGISRTSPNR
jgi:hypothetical protein